MCVVNSYLSQLVIQQIVKMYPLRAMKFSRYVTLMFAVCIISEWTFAAAATSQVYTIPLKKTKETSFAAAVSESDSESEDKVSTPSPRPKVFVEDQRNNIRGRPGLGYYIEVIIGTPDQIVC